MNVALELIGAQNVRRTHPCNQCIRVSEACISRARSRASKPEALKSPHRNPLPKRQSLPSSHMRKRAECALQCRIALRGHRLPGARHGTAEHDSDKDPKHEVILKALRPLAWDLWFRPSALVCVRSFGAVALVGLRLCSVAVYHVILSRLRMASWCQIRGFCLAGFRILRRGAELPSPGSDGTPPATEVQKNLLFTLRRCAFSIQHGPNSRKHKSHNPVNMFRGMIGALLRRTPLQAAPLLTNVMPSLGCC